MSLNYPIQDPVAIIGVKSGTTRTARTLTDYYNLDGNTTKALEVGGMSKITLYGVYTAGSGETSNSLQIVVEGSPDGTNWYRILNDTVSNGTSTLNQREFTITQSTTDGTLAYDGQTGNFTAGLKVTGGTSGATAWIESDSDSGSTGTLTLSNITGTFQNNEAITDTDTGAATVNGVLTSVTTFDLPIDISDKYIRVSTKETGVGSNAGTVYIEAMPSGR